MTKTKVVYEDDMKALSDSTSRIALISKFTYSDQLEDGFLIVLGGVLVSISSHLRMISRRIGSL